MGVEALNRNQENQTQLKMKKLLVPTTIAAAALLCLTGCISAGTGPKTQISNPTLGQQLTDLQKAKEAGAITEAEYQTQKAKLLGN